MDASSGEGNNTTGGGGHQRRYLRPLLGSAARQQDKRTIEWPGFRHPKLWRDRRGGVGRPEG
eukprot:357218-Chlamydomonas_euryale.AAC.30